MEVHDVGTYEEIAQYVPSSIWILKKFHGVQKLLILWTRRYIVATMAEEFIL